jgi:hypothetical protein
LDNPFASLPIVLLQAAFEHGGQYAWARDDALAVIDWLHDHAHPVIGVDVWVPSDRGPIVPAPWIYTWSQSYSGGRTDAIRDPRMFVACFHWDPDDVGFRNAQPYFNLTVGN